MSYRLPPELYEKITGAASDSLVYVKPNEKEPFPYDEEEGLMTRFEGEKYPRPQVADPFALKAADNVKKYLKAFLNPQFTIKGWLDQFAEFAESETAEFWFIENIRPRMVRELLRVGKVLNLDGRIMKSLGVVFEQDLAYRHPFQDIVSLLDKQALQKNPAKEIKRLLFILDERWHHRNKHFKALGWFFWVLLKLSPKARRFIRAFGAEIDLKKMRLSTYDLYVSLLMPRYDIQGLSYPERREMHKTL